MVAAESKTPISRARIFSLTMALVFGFAGFSGACFAQSPTSTGTGLLKRVVLVSLPDRKLAVLDEGIVIATFPIAVGAKDSPSPTGDFLIVSRLANPTYYHPGTIVGPGKDNPVGTRWLGLSQKGYGIHGTNAPRSIGHAASHGCIRLRNRDMERLFTMLQVGDVVQIRGERDGQIAEVFGGTDENTVAEAQPSAQAGGQ
jgi:L,D-transpeptidase catalytic domain